LLLSLQRLLKNQNYIKMKIWESANPIRSKLNYHIN
jgi:hypothetical protein